MKSRLELLRLEIDKLIMEKQPDKEKYFFSHLYGVSHFCSLLALRRNLDIELAATCGMLHDIYQVTAGTIENHAVKGAEQAKQLLEATQLYTDDEIDTITTAVSRHSEKHIAHSPMDELLKDADVMHHSLYDPSVPIYEREKERYANIQRELGRMP